MSQIFKRLPWDYNPTNGGVIILLLGLIFEIQIILFGFGVLSWDPMTWWSLGINSILILFVVKIIGPWGQRWSHFIGTDVVFKTLEAKMEAEQWAYTNLSIDDWSSFVMNRQQRFYSLRFRRRDTALLIKLSV